MEPEIIECEYFEVETTNGTWFVPCDVTNERNLADYVEGEIYSVERHEGWIGRLSMPGYLDCTEWCSYNNEEEAKEDLANHA
jgi:hypothetical protein